MKKMREEKERIVYQNQSHLVLDYFKHLGIQPTMFDLALATDVMTTFCMEGYSPEVKERFAKLDTHIKSTYKK